MKNSKIIAGIAIATCALIVLYSLANSQSDSLSPPSSGSSYSYPSSISPPVHTFTSPATVGEYASEVQRSILDKQLAISQFKLENQGERESVREKEKEVARGPLCRLETVGTMSVGG